MAVALAIIVVSTLTFEWTHSYCTNPEDGPGHAYFGMPLPFLRWSGASSGVYVYSPPLLVANLGVLAALGYPFVHRMLQAVHFEERGRGRRVARLIVLAVCLSVVAPVGMAAAYGMWRPRTVVTTAWEPFMDLRPIRFGWYDLHYECTVSRWWFPADWHGK